MISLVRSRRRAGIFGIVLVLFLAMTWIAAAQEADKEQDHEAALMSDMGAAGQQRSAEIDPAMLAKFKAEYDAAGGSPRPVFEAWLPEVGTAVILDMLEEIFPACHGESHDLGKALVAARDDIGTALSECGTRCTSGCMHGILMEAFGGADIELLKEKSPEFCRTGTMAELHKVGNCVHGIGHAFMAVTGQDVNASLDACRAFEGEALPYYCATGVFMELLLTGPEADEQNRPKAGRSLHYPCDEYAQFPAACYRYRTPHMLRLLGNDVDEVAEACSIRPPAERRGCFHGLGKAHTFAVFKEPARLAEICGHGDSADRALCIEGVIEKLADYNDAKADAACASLEDKGDAKVCRDSAEGKMYRLEKPTMALYWGDAADETATEE